MATTPKIWLMGPDPSKQCCGCGSKTGPCDSCSTFVCSGERYNVDFAKWYQDTSFLSGVIPAHCEIAQSAADSNTITNTSVSLAIANIGPARSNAFTNRFTKGTSGNVNGSFSITTDTIISPFAATYDGSKLFYPTLDSGHELVLYGTSFPSTWATGISWDFDSPPFQQPSPLVTFGSDFTNTGGALMLPFPSHIYPRNANAGTGLGGWIVGVYFDGGETFFTPYAVGGIQAQRVDGSAYNSGPTNINATGATGLFFVDVAAQYQIFSAGIGARSWICDNTVGQFSWDAHSGPFGELATIPSAQSAYESMISSYVAGLPTSGSPVDGNRTLGYLVTFNGQPGYAGDPNEAGIPCNGGNVGQVLTYNGALEFQLYTSTKWPFQGFTASETNHLAIKTANTDACITTLISGGGVSFDGIKTTTKKVTFSYTQNQPLNIAPLVFITGANSSNQHGAQEACPFSLP